MENQEIRFGFDRNMDNTPQENKNQTDLIVSPEIRDMVMEKLRYIYEFGTAYTGLGKFDWIKNRVIEHDGRLGYSNYQSVDGKKQEKFTQFDESNIRDFVKQNQYKESFADILKYGVQCNSELSPFSKNKIEYKQNNANIKKKYQEYIESFKRNYGSTDHLHNHDRQRVYFNVVGRSIHDYAHFSNNYARGGISLVFLPPSKETDNFNKKKDQLKFGEYSLNHAYSGSWKKLLKDYPDFNLNGDPRVIDELRNLKKDNNISSGDVYEKHSTWDAPTVLTGFTKDGLVRSSSDTGFELRTRIPPRKFLGIVVNTSGIKDLILSEDLVEEDEDITDSELLERFKKTYKALRDNDESSVKKHKESFARFISSIMQEACKDHPENIIPIYDEDGNLLWPEQILRDDVVKITNAEINENDPYYKK